MTTAERLQIAAVEDQQLRQVCLLAREARWVSLPKQGGRLRVESRDWDDRGVVLRARDHGHGIPADELDQIFNRSHKLTQS